MTKPTNLFSELPSNLPKEWIEKLVDAPGIRIERAILLQEAVGKYLKENTSETCRKISDHFEKFTRQHIARVNAVASFIGEHYPDHDADKFELPFYYILQYKHSGTKLEDTVKNVEEVNALIGKATWEHIKQNKHHPEYWDKSLPLDTPFDRKKPRMGIDATNMPESALREFVCDCVAMSIYLKNDPNEAFEWFRDNISDVNTKRWNMTGKQIEYLYNLAEHIIVKLKDKTRKVYFDVDGVLRDVIGYFGVPDDDWDVQVNGKTIFQEIGDDFACLEKMPPTEFVPVIKKFTDSPHVISTQIQPEAQTATTKWLSKHFKGAQPTYVGEGGSQEKNSLLNENDRIFDDHPQFPESNKLIVLGHGYNEHKSGFRVNTPDEIEAVLEVLRGW